MDDPVGCIRTGFLAIMILVLVFLVGYNAGRSTEQRAAVEASVARWSADPKHPADSAAYSFRFRTNP